MSDHDQPTVLIVRGAGPAGRRIANAVQAAGATTVVLDERTCAHDGVHAVRVPFDDVAQPRRAVHDLTVRYGSFEAMVLLPPPVDAKGDGSLGPSLDPTWEFDLGQELTLVAGLVRVAAPTLATVSGVVMPVSASPELHEPTHRATLFAQSYLPALRALAAEFGLRLAPVETEATGTARGTAVAARLLEELGSDASVTGPAGSVPGASPAVR